MRLGVWHHHLESRLELLRGCSKVSSSDGSWKNLSCCCCIEMTGYFWNTIHQQKLILLKLKEKKFVFAYLLNLRDTEKEDIDKLGQLQ